MIIALIVCAALVACFAFKPSRNILLGLFALIGTSLATIWMILWAVIYIVFWLAILIGVPTGAIYGAWYLFHRL